MSLYQLNITIYQYSNISFSIGRQFRGTQGGGFVATLRSCRGVFTPKNIFLFLFVNNITHRGFDQHLHAYTVRTV